MSNKKQERLLTDGELAGVARHFKLLGEPMRLKILQAVCRAPRTVTDIVVVSKHLALLAAAGILTRKKDGQCVYYGMKDPLTLKLCELVHTQLAV